VYYLLSGRKYPTMSYIYGYLRMVEEVLPVVVVVAGVIEMAGVAGVRAGVSSYDFTRTC